MIYYIQYAVFASPCPRRSMFRKLSYDKGKAIFRLSSTWSANEWGWESPALFSTVGLELVVRRICFPPFSTCREVLNFWRLWHTLGVFLLRDHFTYINIFVPFDYFLHFFLCVGGGGHFLLSLFYLYGKKKIISSEVLVSSPECGHQNSIFKLASYLSVAPPGLILAWAIHSFHLGSRRNKKLSQVIDCNNEFPRLSAPCAPLTEQQPVDGAPNVTFTETPVGEAPDGAEDYWRSLFLACVFMCVKERWIGI